MKVNPEKRYTRSDLLKFAIYYNHVNMWIMSFWHIFHILSYLLLFQSLALVPCGGHRKLPRASVVCSFIFSSIVEYMLGWKDTVFTFPVPQLLAISNTVDKFACNIFWLWFIKSNILPVFQYFDPQRV